MRNFEYDVILCIAIYIKVRNNITASYPNCPITPLNTIGTCFCFFNTNTCSTLFIKYPLSFKFFKNLI